MKISDNLLIKMAEGNVASKKKKEIEKLIKINKSIKKRYDRFKRTLLLLSNFGKSFETRKNLNKIKEVKKYQRSQSIRISSKSAII